MKTILSLCILIFTVVCRAATPQDILNSAAAYQAFSDRDLKIANVYMLAQLSGTSASSVASNSAPYQALSERQLLEAQTWLLSQVSGGGATNLTPWTSDINGAAHSLTNVASVTNTGNIQTVTLNATTSITVGGTGGATFNGGFTTVGQTNSNWTYGFASVNDSSGRMTNTFNGSGLTNLDYLLTTNAINTGVGAVGKANITNLTGNVTLGGFSGLVNDKWNTVIWVCQASSANLTVTFPANTYTPDGVHSCVVTNGLWKVISFSILPGLLTNACSVGTF